MCSYVATFFRVPELLHTREVHFSWKCVCTFTFLLTITVFLSLVSCGTWFSFFFQTRSRLRNHLAATRSLLVCFVVYGPMTSGGVFFFNEERPLSLFSSGSSVLFAVEFVSRLHNLRKSFVLQPANQIAEPSGALQGHFMRSLSISSRITSSSGDEVEVQKIDHQSNILGPRLLYRIL